MMLCFGLHGLRRVYREQFRSTQSLHRANPVNTESTQSDLGSTQRLHRGMPTYTGSTQNNMGSTQSNIDLHRVYKEQFTDYRQLLHRVYTDQFGAYTESPQSNTDLHRGNID